MLEQWAKMGLKKNPTHLAMEVLLDDLKSLLVYLHVLVALQHLDLVQPEALVDQQSVGVVAERVLRLLCIKI